MPDPNEADTASKIKKPLAGGSLKRKYVSCLTPNTLYYTEDGITTFNKEKGFNPFSIPCGQCLGCRIDHSRDWALCVMHHSKQFEKNCFITLTFNEQHLAGRKSVRVKDWQLFMYRLTEKFNREKRPRPQYFHSTEYGEKRQRPHHHAILFNYFPPDAEVYKNVSGNIYYTSQELSDLWKHQGFIVIGQLTYQTAAYTAAYTFKKQRGKDYPEGITPEKMTCSQGIGISHFLQYYKEYCQLGHILFNGKKFRIPRRYLKVLNPDLHTRKSLIKKGVPIQELDDRLNTYLNLKQDRELNAYEDSILDRLKKYQYLVHNQQQYKKRLYNDSPLSDDNRYLRHLKSLQLQIMEVSGEYHPEKKEKLYEDLRRL